MTGGGGRRQNDSLTSFSRAISKLSPWDSGCRSVGTYKLKGKNNGKKT